MKLRTKAAAMLAAAGIATGALISVASGANAASAPCSGYTYRSKAAVNVPYGGGARVTVGYTYWYQKSYAHSPTRMCAVTRPTSTYAGKTNWLDVFLESDSGSDRDRGNYRYYAGPVTVARSGYVTLYAEVGIKGGKKYSTLVYI
ncbi:hypothetical protein Airi02_062990 [Actinoallomurus iriomotensis]|uniref:Uncharacterized protein n=1 Tax=Actinoallomurus iriomotensis TaxID=478107 RepID=A0A9W6W1X6_9ACTN|nr:hypothetical protein Airi02_062990 [Actinoallomurus iriomotensis]